MKLPGRGLPCGCWVRWHSTCTARNIDHLQKELGRAYTDIDYAGYKARPLRSENSFYSLGYKEDLEVNTLFAGERLIYNHPNQWFAYRYLL